MDVFSTASDSIALLDQIVRLIQRVKNAAAQVQQLPQVLENYNAEVTQIKEWIELVEVEPALQILGIEKTIDKITKLAERLKTHLQKMNTERTPTKQFMHQFKSGDADRTLIDRILNDMSSVKIDLIVRIQLALIGISKSIQSVVQLQADVLKDMNQKLPPPAANREYPKLIQLLLDKNQPSPDGTVTVTKEDLEDLLKASGLELKLDSDQREGSRAKKTIKDNVISETAFVVTGPQCPEDVDPWRDADYTLEGNTINGYGMMHAQPNTDALKIMADTRVSEMNARYGVGR